jgi:hypothetical protein
MRRAVLILGAAFAVLLCDSATAVAKVEIARSRGLNARLVSSGGGVNQFRMRLEIRAGGALIYDDPVDSRLCRRYCGPLQTGADRSAVRVVAMSPGGPPAVVLSLYTEHANCCTLKQVFTRRPGGVAEFQHNFGAAGARLVDLRGDGRLAFVSADNAFSDRFASFAASGAPLQVWAFRHGRFVDVTRAYPRQIAADAERWWLDYERNFRDGEGFFAAWAADECLLGHQDTVRRTLAVEAQAGHLRTDRRGAPRGEEFGVALKAFLRHRGYVG